MRDVNSLFEEIFRMESTANFKGSWGFWHILQHGTREERKQLQVKKPIQCQIRTLIHKYNISSQLYQLLEAQTQAITGPY